MSHVIYRGHFSRHPKNVAIPTRQIQYLNEPWGNYVRNCWLTAIAGLHDDAPNQRPSPTGVEGAGGTGGHGWASRRGQAAVPVGGGRARAGLEIDHSEPQARVWRSRGRAAARRHTQRPGPSRKAPGDRNTGATSSSVLSGASRRLEIWRRRKQIDAIGQKAVAPRKTWGPPLIRSHA